MWSEDNDKILEILNCIYTSEAVFPVICPVCGKREGHIYARICRQRARRVMALVQRVSSLISFKLQDSVLVEKFRDH